MSEQLTGNPYGESLEPFAGQHMELDATLALTYELRTSNLLQLMRYMEECGDGVLAEKLQPVLIDRIGLRELVDRHGLAEEVDDDE